MVHIFIKDITNTKFNNYYIKLDSLEYTLYDLKKILVDKFSIKDDLIIFVEESKYLYKNYKLKELNNHKFINLKMHIKNCMP